jgi:hypothetical protein
MDQVLKEALVLKQGEELFAPEEECTPFNIEACMDIKMPQNNEVTTH